MDVNTTEIVKARTPSNKKNEQGQASRQKILTAAELVFFEKGVSTTTLEMIVERAEVTRGAIYWHFKNKQEILEEVLDSTALPLMAKFKEILNRAPKADIMTLRRASIEPMLMISRSASLRRRLAISFLRCEYIEDNIRLLEKERVYDDQMVTLVTNYLKAIVAQDKTLFLSKPPRLLAEAYCAYWMGIIIQFLKHPDRMSLVRHTSDYVDIFLMPMFARKDMPIGTASQRLQYQDKD